MNTINMLCQDTYCLILSYLEIPDIINNIKTNKSVRKMIYNNLEYISYLEDKPINGWFIKKFKNLKYVKLPFNENLQDKDFGQNIIRFILANNNNISNKFILKNPKLTELIVDGENMSNKALLTLKSLKILKLFSNNKIKESTIMELQKLVKLEIFLDSQLTNKSFRKCKNLVSLSLSFNANINDNIIKFNKNIKMVKTHNYQYKKN